MLIKGADDRTADLSTLNSLLAGRGTSSSARQLIEQEIRSIRAGTVGERDAAYEIEFYFGNSANYATIHDLRLDHGGRVAQIDHLIINRVLQVWVCESKHFVDSVSINAQGEWTRGYHGREYGVPSPIEQNKKHVDVLEAVLRSGAVSLPRRIFTMRPELLSLVLVSNNAVIKRPPKGSRVEGIDTVIKAERLKSGVYDTWDDSVRTMFQRLVSADRIQRIARDLVALHRPIAFDWAAKFGVDPVDDLAPPATSSRPSVPPRRSPTDPSGKLCDRCGGSTTFAEVAFCRYNSRRFDGKAYCRPCQGFVETRSR